MTTATKTKLKVFPLADRVAIRPMEEAAVLLTDATWYGVPCQTPTTSMSLGILKR